MKTHKDLDVWNLSIELVTAIYKITQKFPEEEKYGLTAQIRRAAVSIPSNIAEGAARGSDKEFIRFLYFSMGSTMELETQFIISKNLSYLNEETFNKINTELNSIGKMINGLIKHLKNRTQ